MPFFQLDTVEQLKNITQLKVYKYNYDNDYAKYAGLSKLDIADTGVIAQELSKVLPDAVRDTGDIILPSGNQLDNFQVVNKVGDSIGLYGFARFLVGISVVFAKVAYHEEEE